MSRVEGRRVIGRLPSIDALAGGLLLIAPVSAEAQQISNAIALAALSPILVVILAGLVGWLERDLVRGLIDVGLVLLWVFVFVVFAYFVTVDWIIWTPVVLYAMHAIWLACRLLKALVGRR